MRRDWPCHGDEKGFVGFKFLGEKGGLRCTECIFQIQLLDLIVMEEVSYSRADVDVRISSLTYLN